MKGGARKQETPAFGNSPSPQPDGTGTAIAGIDGPGLSRPPETPRQFATTKPIAPIPIEANQQPIPEPRPWHFAIVARSGLIFDIPNISPLARLPKGNHGRPPGQARICPATDLSCSHGIFRANCCESGGPRR